MAARNPKTHVKVQTLFFPATVSSTQTLNNSAPNLNVDTLGFTHAVVIIPTGAAVTAGGDTITVTMKESLTNDGLGYTAISAAAFLPVTGTGDNTQILGELDLRARQRYLSATLTAAGTPGHAMCVIVVLFNPEDTGILSQTYAFSA